MAVTPATRGRGRPTKFDPERAQLLINAVAAGNTLRTACAYARIGYTTLKDWRRIGARKPEGDPLRQFSDDIEYAEAQAEVRNVTVINTAANTHWQAAAWWLERRRHKDWRRKDKDSIDVGIDAAQQVLGDKKASPEEKRSAAQDLLRIARQRIRLETEEQGKPKA